MYEAVLCLQENLFSDPSSDYSNQALAPPVHTPYGMPAYSAQGPDPSGYGAAPPQQYYGTAPSGMQPQQYAAQPNYAQQWAPEHAPSTFPGAAFAQHQQPQQQQQFPPSFGYATAPAAQSGYAQPWGAVPAGPPQQQFAPFNPQQQFAATNSYGMPAAPLSSAMPHSNSGWPPTAVQPAPQPISAAPVSDAFGDLFVSKPAASSAVNISNPFGDVIAAKSAAPSLKPVAAAPPASSVNAPAQAYGSNYGENPFGASPESYSMSSTLSPTPQLDSWSTAAPNGIAPNGGFPPPAAAPLAATSSNPFDMAW